MKHTTLLNLAGLLTVAAISIPTFASAGDSPSAPRTPTIEAPSTATQNAPELLSSEPATTQAVGLCGMTPADVAGIVNFYGLDPHMPSVAQSLQPTLNCGAYGGLCTAMGTVAAEQYACSVWDDLSNHEPLPDVVANSMTVLGQALGECTPNTEACEEICQNVGSGEVLRCDGVLIAGQCRSVAACELSFINHIKFFDFLSDSIP